MLDPAPDAGALLKRALEFLAFGDDWNKWPDSLKMQVLPDMPEDRPLASHAREMVTMLLIDEYDSSDSGDRR